MCMCVLGGRGGWHSGCTCLNSLPFIGWTSGRAPLSLSHTFIWASFSLSLLHTHPPRLSSLSLFVHPYIHKHTDTQTHNNTHTPCRKTFTHCLSYAPTHTHTTHPHTQRERERERLHNILLWPHKETLPNTNTPTPEATAGL